MFAASIFDPQGYLSILVLMVLTGCGLPFPEEVFIVSAGVFSAVGKLDPWWAYGACLAGALLGDAAMYGIGYFFGRTLLSRHPKLARFLGAGREAEYAEAIQRHGFKVLLLSRFMVGVRGPVYLSAGLLRTPFRQFLGWDLVCATLVVSIFFGLSYRYGNDIAEFASSAERMFTLAVLFAALIGALWFVRKRRAEILEKVLDEDDETTTS